MGEPAIAVSGLRKSFDAKEAVAGIDLEMAAGSLAGLVGPNGAAKTTSLPTRSQSQPTDQTWRQWPDQLVLRG